MALVAGVALALAGCPKGHTAFLGGRLAATVPPGAVLGAQRAAPRTRRSAAESEDSDASGAWARRSGLLAAVGAVPLALAAGARADDRQRTKVVDKVGYSSQESAGLAGQSNKDVAKYADFGEGLKVARLDTPKFAEGDPDGKRTVQKGDSVTVDLIGYLAGYNGLVFVRTQDKSGYSEFPVTFKVGEGVAIPGLDRGVVGMVKGEKRRIVIPANLGYPRPLKDEDLGKPGTIPNPMESTSANGAPWELRNRLLNGVINNSQRDDTLVMDVKLKRIS